jgi:hypothetical protein
MSVALDDDRVRDPEMENDVLDEIHDLLGGNFGQGHHFDPLGKFIDRDEQVSQADGCLLGKSTACLKGPRRSRPHIVNGQVMGIVWSTWVGV